MLIRSYGRERFHDFTEHVAPNVRVGLPTIESLRFGPHAQFHVVGKRKVDVFLNPNEVVSAFLTLKPEMLAEAITMVGEKFDLAEELPEIMKHLSAGAIASLQKPKAGPKWKIS